MFLFVFMHKHLVYGDIDSCCIAFLLFFSRNNKDVRWVRFDILSLRYFALRASQKL